MKAVILAGGRGERLGATGNKCMTYYKGFPLLYHNLYNAVTKAKVDEIILLVGFKPEMVINYFGNRFRNTKITYAFQPEPLGIVDAINCCCEYIKKDDFLLMLGDEIILNPNHKSMINYYHSKKECFGLCGVVKTDNLHNISKTYNFIDDNRKIIRLIEKPKHIFNNLMGTGNCVFNNSILDYIDITPVNTRRGRQERELVDLIQCAVDDGQIIEWFLIGDKYENVNDENCLLNLVNWE